MSYKYILKDKKPVLCDDIIEWGTWFEKANKHVKNDHVTVRGKKIHISTVFLGLDHGYDGEVLLFETIIFGGENDEERWRYATWDEAEAGHKKALDLVKLK